MARRTLHIPDDVEALIRANAREGESYSAAACRLIVEGARRTGKRIPPEFVAIGSTDVPADLARRVQHYIRHPVEMR